jgi:adenylylsulfate kinase
LWRIVATLTTAIIAYAITGEVDTELMIGGIECLLKIGIYYAHERLWLWLA